MRLELKALVKMQDRSLDECDCDTGVLGLYLRLVFTADLKPSVSIREEKPVYEPFCPALTRSR